MQQRGSVDDGWGGTHEAQDGIVWQREGSSCDHFRQWSADLPQVTGVKAVRSNAGAMRDGERWAWGDEGYGWKEHADTVRLSSLAHSPSVRARSARARQCCGCSAAQDRIGSDGVDGDSIHLVGCNQDICLPGSMYWMSGCSGIWTLMCGFDVPTWLRFNRGARPSDIHVGRCLGWIGSGALHALICQCRAQSIQGATGERNLQSQSAPDGDVPADTPPDPRISDTWFELLA